MRSFSWHPLSNLSFRTKLIISNAILATAIIIAMAYYLISRATATNDFLATQLTGAVQAVTENDLRGRTTRFADELDQFFGSLLSHMETIKGTLQIVLASENAIAPVSSSSLSRLPQGSWDNPNTDPVSIFIPNQQRIPPTILSEISVVREIDSTVPGIMKKNPDVLAIYFGSVLGEMLYYPNIDLPASLPPDYDVTKQSWFVQANPQANPARGTVCGDPYRNASQKPIITCSTPVFDPSDQFRGVVAMDIQLQYAIDYISVIPVGISGYAFLIDSQGHVISMPENGYSDFRLVVGPGEDPLTKSILKTAPIEVFSAMGWMTEGLSGLRTVTIGDTSKYFAFSPIKSVRYSVGLVVPVSEMQEQVVATQTRLSSERRDTLIKLIEGSVLVLIIFLLATLWLGTALTSPVLRLTQTASLIAQGDLNHTAAVESKDEIGVLAGTLNLMTKNLRDLINDLERRVAERTEELQASNVNLEQRIAELAIVNNMSQALAQWLDIAEITRIVGDKVREIFTAEVTEILMLHESTGMIHAEYSYYRGYRHYEPFPFGEGLTSRIIQTRLPLTHQTLEDAIAFGALFQSEEDKTQSYIGVPILSGDHAVGVLSVQSYQPYAFDENHVRLLSTLAANMGVAMEKARLFDETQRLFKAEQQRNAELAILNDVGKALARALDVKTLTRDIGDILHNVLEAEIVDILLYDQRSNLVRLAYSFNSGYFEDEPPWRLEEGGLTTKVIVSGQPLLLNSAQEMAENGAIAYVTTPSDEPDPQSFLGVPIMVGEQALGVLAVQSLRPNAFDGNNLHLLQTISSNMGVALENARLFDETQRLLEETRKAKESAEILRAANLALTQNLNLDAISEELLTLLHQIAPYDSASIFLLESNSRLVARATRGYEAWMKNPVPAQTAAFDIMPGTVMYNVVNGKSYLIHDAHQSQEWEAIPGEEYILSWLGVPMMIGDKIVGVISLDKNRLNFFTEEMVELSTSLGAQAAFAIQNARLFDETQRLLKETEQRNAELAIINSIGQILTEELDLSTMVERVGDQLRAALKVKNIGIGIYNEKENLMQAPYIYRDGRRLVVRPFALNPFNRRVSKAGRSLVVNRDAERLWLKLGGISAENEIPKSFVMVPLLAGRELVGGISLQDFENENAFAELSVGLLESVASNMGTAILNARLFEETQQRNAELAILNNVGEAMAQTLDVKLLTRNVGDKVREIFKAEIADILLYDPVSNMVQLAYSYSAGYFDDEPPWRLEEGGLTTQIILSGQPLLLKSAQEMDAQGAVAYITTPTGEPDPQSYLGVPIAIGDRVLGVVDVQSLRPAAFDENSLRLLQTLSSNIGVALENARLFDETQRLLKETEQRAAELAIINSVQAGLVAQMDIQAIYDLVGDKICEIFDAQVVDIVLYDPVEHLLHFRYTIERGVHLPIPPIKLMGFRKHVIETRRYLLLNDLTGEVRAQYGQLTPIHGEAAKSIVFVPMVVGDVAKGVISLQNLDHAHAFSDSDVRLLQTFANSMSVALENARLFDETQRLLKESEQRAAELAAISKVSQALVAESELDNIIQLIGNQIREIFDADIVYVALLDPQTNLIHFPYQIGETFTILQVEEGHTGRIIQTGEPLLINKNVDERSKELGVTQVGKDALSYLGVPIKAGGETIGVISVQNTTQEGLFNDDSLRLLTTIASSAGAAIHTARLHTETKRNANQMATIANVGRELSATLDLQRVIRIVVEHVHNLFQASDTSLRLTDSGGVALRTALALGQYAEEYSADVLLMGEGITGSVAQSGIAEVIEDVDLDPRGLHVAGTPEWEEVPQTMMVAPLIAGNRTIGVISVYRDRSTGTFSQVDLDFLVGLGRQAAIAIENSRLFDETERLLKQTEQRATELQIINNIGQILTEGGDLNTMIEHVGDKLREAFNFGNIRIAVVDEKTGSLIAPYVYHHGKRIAFEEYWQEKSARYRLLMRVSARTGTRSWVVNTNAEKSWRKFAIEINEEDIPKSFVTLPLWAGREVIGGISIPDYEKENAFTDFSIGMLETIATNMGTAIQNARLFEETKRLFNEAQESRAAAEQANKAKSTFLANMSHELRTPLNAIMGFTRIVKRKGEGVLPEKQFENLDKVLSSSEHLLGLINTVLDIAKIEAGRMDVIPAKFNLSQLADQCANLATPLLKPNVTLEKQVDESIGIIFSDQDKIKQIVLNLLSNAAKFTHEGRILLSVEKFNEENVDISVTDSGIGINEEALNRVFEEFQQADNTTTRQYGGTGLGLAISRNLARLLGGDLTARSELGKGSTFTLTLPIQYGRKSTLRQAQDAVSASDRETGSVQQAVAQPTYAAPKHRILIIDDDPDALYLLREGLGTNQFEILGARNGSMGMQIARDEHPEAILLDILMPEADGWQILNDLKTDPATAMIPVILLTIVDKKALGFKLGAADYLLKPLDPSLVLSALQRVIGEQGHPYKHILVVDDDPHITEMLRQTLPEAGFRLESAEDGEAGLQVIQARRPDVILLDLMMPKLDGFGVIERLRADSELRNIPIIVISAKELTAEEANLLKESVVSVMKKQGFDGNLLAQELNSVVQK